MGIIYEKLRMRLAAAWDAIMTDWRESSSPRRARLIACVLMALALLVLSGISIALRKPERLRANDARELDGVWLVGENPEGIVDLPVQGEPGTLAVRFKGGLAHLSGDSSLAPQGVAEQPYTLSDGRLTIGANVYETALHDGVLLLRSGERGEPDACLTRVGSGDGITGDWQNEDGLTVMTITPDSLRLCAVRLTEHEDDLREMMAERGINNAGIDGALAEPNAAAETMNALFGFDAAAFPDCEITPKYNRDGDYIVLRAMLTLPCLAADGAVIPAREYANAVWRRLNGCFFYRIEGDALSIYLADVALIRE